MKPSRHPSVIVAGLLATTVLSGCGLQIPRDPDGTLDAVTDGALRVGVSASGDQVDRERALVEGFADRLDAEIRWQDGGEEQLMSALEDGELDLVIGGLTDATPWTTHAAITRPYDEATDDHGRALRYVMAAPLGENAFLVELETYLTEHGS